MGVKVERDVFFGRGVKFFAPERLQFGERCSLGDNAHIACHESIVIGDDFLSAPGLSLNSGQHEVVTLRGFGASIIIGDRVWCGQNVTVCAGVTIGNDVVIGAGSVVVNSLPDGVVACGVPAKVIRTIDRTGIEIERAFT